MFLQLSGTESGTAIQTALNNVGPGGTVRLAPGVMYYVTSLNIPASVTLLGTTVSVDNPGGINQACLVGQQGGIALESTGTITVNGASCLKDIVIIRADSGVPMTIPATSAASFAGTAITAAPQTGVIGTANSRGADGFMLDNVLVAGFAKALVSINASRGTIQRFRFDANPGTGNAAMQISGSADSFRIRDVHGWPFAMSPSAGSPLRRFGTGFLLSGQNDDTEIDGVLMINFDINVDIQGAGAINIGRLWTDSGLAGAGSRGLRIGNNVSNIVIASLQAWGSETAIESAAGPGNRNVITTAHIDTVTGSAILVSGGNLSMGVVTTRSVPDGQFVLRITNPSSFVSGTIIDENNGSSSPISVPTGATTSFLDDLRIYSPYRPAGTPMFTGGPIGYPVIGAAPTLALPPVGRAFKVTGSTTISTIAGGHGARRIRLKFAGTCTLATGGNLSHTNGSSRPAVPGSVIEYEFDGESATWQEVSWKA